MKKGSGGVIGFKKQVGHTEINEGVHYCPVNEGRFRSTSERNIMPKNAAKYKTEIVYAFSKQ
jgi:hypothetical protein